MRRLFLAVLLLALTFAVPAFSQQRWERTYGGTGGDGGESVQQTSDAGYIVAGPTTSFGDSTQVYLIKTNASGDTLWTKTYGGTSDEWGYSVKQTTDGGYIVVGGTDSYGNGNQVYLLKTNASGDTLWTRNYGGADYDWGWSVQQTTDTGYIVAGMSTSFGSIEQVYLLKINASGDTLWTKTYGGSGGDMGYAVQQTSDGGYIIAGYTDTFVNGRQDYLVKTNAAGDTLWTRDFGGTSTEEGYSVEQTSDGGYIIAGHTNSFGEGYQVFLVKTNAGGDTLWTRTFGGAGWDFGYSVQQTTDGGYIAVGYTTSFGNGEQVYLIKTNASGDTLWTKTYGGAGWDAGYFVQQTTDGGYIVAGSTSSFGNGYQVYLIKTDANGNVGVEEESRQGDKGTGGQGERLKATPNPFTSFATLPGHEAERFSLYDVSGRKVGTFRGDRIGEGLAPGVYFLRYQEMLKQVQHDEIVRIVKVR